MPAAAVPIIEIAATAVSAYVAYKGYESEKATTKAIAAQRQQQIDESAQVQELQRRKQAEARAAQIRTSAAQSGVGGNSVAAMLNDVMFQSGQDVSLIEKNRQWGISANQTEAWARNQESTANLASSLSSSAMSGLNSYSQYKKYQISTDGG